MKKTILFMLLFLVSCTTAPQSELSPRSPTQSVVLSDGDAFALEAKMVESVIAERKVVLLGYNGQVPGPLFKVKQNSTIKINFTNSLKIPTSIHWHGLRLENRYDGVPDVTQKLVQPGESFEYVLSFPDDGMYWYHPHQREDMQQELGLYGAILVEPKTPYSPIDREEVLVLDDILLDEKGVVPFDGRVATHALMGRFGNVMLVNGAEQYVLNVTTGEVVRFYLVDAANTRMFNVSIENQTLKIIGSDSGLKEKDVFANSAVLAPGERAIIDAVFNTPGVFKIMHKNPLKSYVLGEVRVAGSSTNATQTIDAHAAVSSDVGRFKSYLNDSPDHEFILTVQTHGMMHGAMMGSSEKVEWEDTMPLMNARMTSADTKWIIKDKKTGKENMDIKLNAKVGDVQKLRFMNDPRSMHPMQHPIHLHGQRFLVTAIDGVGQENLAWKDTVVVPVGSSVDILVEFTNPGNWMFHCHISEHLESGMMGMFEVSA